MNARESLVIASAFLLCGGLAGAQNDSKDILKRAAAGAGNMSNVTGIVVDQTQADTKSGTAKPACGVPEVVDASQAGDAHTVNVNDLWSKKYILGIYDHADSSRWNVLCAVMEKLSKDPAYRDKVFFAKVKSDRLDNLGLKSRLGISGVVSMDHFYMLDGAPAKHDFDQAAPSQTSSFNKPYTDEEYFRTALWRCLDVAPRAPAPKPIPDRVQCFPECPSRPANWQCQISD